MSATTPAYAPKQRSCSLIRSASLGPTLLARYCSLSWAAWTLCRQTDHVRRASLERRTTVLALSGGSLALTGALWRSLALSGALWRSLALSGALWRSLAAFNTGGPTPRSLAISGGLWRSLALSLAGLHPRSAAVSYGLVSSIHHVVERGGPIGKDLTSPNRNFLREEADREGFDLSELQFFLGRRCRKPYKACYMGRNFAAKAMFRNISGTFFCSST